MEATSLELGDVWQPASPPAEGETVCAALTRYENTLRDAIREIRLDVSTFKLGMERHLEETASQGGSLGAAVAQLQQENQQLRSQLEALNRQVELLMAGSTHRNNQQEGREGREVTYVRGEAHAHSPVQHHLQASTQSPSGPAVPPAPFSSPPTTRVSSTGTSSPSVTRFSSRAIFSVSSKSSSIEREEPIEIDPALPPPGQNGHAASTEHVLLAEGNFSPPSQSPHQQTAPVAVRTPHLPVTAITKTAEVKTPSSASPSSTISEASLSDQSAANAAQSRPIEEHPIQPGSFVNTWTPTPVRALGPPEKVNSAAAKSVTYSGLLQHDRDGDMPRLAGERRRELVRSQTLPRNIGAQARRSVFERPDSEASHSRPKPPESKPKLKRSQSFGVSSASSIKQILLEWCRSKTLGYQNINIQNFSSSWSDGLAFCALLHSFFPSEFDYASLSPAHRQHNFELAFGTAEVKAGCDRLIEVDDMMVMGLKPDPMCVFTYVQSLYNHLRRLE